MKYYLHPSKSINEILILYRIDPSVILYYLISNVKPGMDLFHSVFLKQFGQGRSIKFYFLKKYLTVIHLTFILINLISFSPGV